MHCDALAHDTATSGSLDVSRPIPVHVVPLLVVMAMDWKLQTSKSWQYPTATHVAEVPLGWQDTPRSAPIFDGEGWPTLVQASPPVPVVPCQTLADRKLFVTMAMHVDVLAQLAVISSDCGEVPSWVGVLHVGAPPEMDSCATNTLVPFPWIPPR
jgi:hypothetical protein